MNHASHIVNCPNCGGHAGRYFLSDRVRTQCPHCDYLMVTSAETGEIIENYGPGAFASSNAVSHSDKDEKALIVSVEIGKYSPVDAAAEELATLCKALNAYHIAQGGNGLEIGDWEILIPTRELVGA